MSGTLTEATVQQGCSFRNGLATLGFGMLGPMQQAGVDISAKETWLVGCFSMHALKTCDSAGVSAVFG